MALTALKIKSLTNPGIYSDGNGLYLQVSNAGTHSWVFKYRFDGKQRSMGLGRADTSGLTLAQARERVVMLKIGIREGVDPLQARADEAAERERERQHRATLLTFKQAAEEFLATGRIQSLRNDKHRAQWGSTLETYAFPFIGEKLVGDITVEDLEAILSPIWNTKRETARRLRSRIESVLNSRTAKRQRSGINPASKEELADWIAEQGDPIRNSHHHAAVSLRDMPAWFAQLRSMEGVAARTLEFAVLCASRSGEARGARWSEIDLETRTWTIPAARMKMKRPHTIPLSAAAVALLERLPRFSGTDLIFPSVRNGQLSDMTISAVMRRMHASEIEAGRKGWNDAQSKRPAVPHGTCRSTFRDWAAELTDFPAEMAELALAHAVGTKVEQAYRRQSMLEKRRLMMQLWANFCLNQAAADNVVRLQA